MLYNKWSEKWKTEYLKVLKIVEWVYFCPLEVTLLFVPILNRSIKQYKKSYMNVH